MAHRTLLSLLALLLLPTAACAEPPPGEDPDEPVPTSPKPAMLGLVQATGTLLPLSLRDGAFADPNNAEAIHAALSALDGHAERLERYGWGEDAGFAWLARSLSEDAADARIAYDLRRFDSAAFHAQRLTMNCVSCHSRLPDDQGSLLGEALVEATDATGLTADEKAFLQQATRQFEAAATTWEEVLADVPTDRASAGLWWLSDYLVLTIRVLDAPERALPVLTRWQASPALPSFARPDIEAWRSSLAELAKAKPPKDRAALLQRARELMKRAEAASALPTGRQGLVDHVAASALLLRYLDGHAEGGDDLAEAYWLLGRAEAAIGAAPSLSLPEYYLEAAVRAAPASDVAREALDLLSWRVAVQYTGSGGEQVPVEVRAGLDELQALVDAANPGRKR